MRCVRPPHPRPWGACQVWGRLKRASGEVFWLAWSSSPVRSLLLALLLASGCAGRPPPSPSGETVLHPEPPPGPLETCRQDFSGLWRHSEDDGFLYLAQDDGGVLTLKALRTAKDGGSQSSEVVLVRSPGNFVGAVGLARLQGDAGCAALFPAEVVSCADAGLVVATVDKLRVDGQCRPVGAPAERRLHRLVRVAPDGGS